MYSISSKLNSAFSTIGKATVNKIIAKLVGTHAFAFMWIIISNMRSRNEFGTFLCFQISILSHLQWKLIVIELPVTFPSFGYLYLGILGFKSEQLYAYLWTPDFCIFNLRRPPWFVCLVYSLLSNIFYWVLLSFYRTPEDRTKLALNLHRWKMIYLNIIGLFLSCFWSTTFIFFSLRCIRRAAKKMSDFFFLNWYYMCFHPHFLVFF